MIEKIDVEGRKLIMVSSNGTFIKDFNQEIAETIIHIDKIFIKLKLVQGDKENRNIFCLNEKMEILWQVQDPDDYWSHIAKHAIKTHARFTGIRITPEGKLIANNVDSHIYALDLETGEILSAEYTR